jgi:flavin reductase (DIM6/NTAB) family NADH-FMN oxidoreductase RutF
MQFDPATMAERDIYKLVIGSIVPRPIAWTSSRAADGTLNLAPFSYFMAVASVPPTLAVSVGYRHGQPKDTLHNIAAAGEFVVNIVNEDVAEQMNLTSGNYTANVDEFALAGLTPLPSIKVAAPRVAESPINLECRVEQIVPIGESNGLIIGRIVYFHVRDDLLDNGRIDQDALRAVGRLAGDGYTRTRDQFSMKRPP